MVDIVRKDLAQKRKRKRIIMISGACLVLIVLFVGLSQLKPATPSVEKGAVWIDTVKRGPLLVEVRGVGTLIPENNRLITALSNGVVEELYIFPGAAIEENTLILRMSNPQLEQDAKNAELDLESSKAELANQEVLLQSQMLQMKANFAQLEAGFRQAQKLVEVNQELFEEGLLAKVTLEQSKLDQDQFEKRFELEKQRLTFQQEAHEAQLNTFRVNIKQLEAVEALLSRQVENLSVRAGIQGILQRLPVEVGQQLALGEVLAEVADPTKLKAVIEIQETQARDILIGQKATIDTRNGLIEGQVFRIDPAVENGTVAVDIQLTSKYPRGARPDLTVEGTIELQRIPDTVYVGRPAFGREESSMSLFKFETEASTYAMRTKVKFGRSSVSVIQVLEGLKPGDRVILSDASEWEKFDRINVN